MLRPIAQNVGDEASEYLREVAASNPRSKTDARILNPVVEKVSFTKMMREVLVALLCCRF